MPHHLMSAVRTLGACLLVALQGAALPSPALAAEAKVPPLAVYGIWRGTLGQQTVVVKLGPKECSSSYYVLRERLSVPLAPNAEQGLQWHEGSAAEPGPTWALTQVKATTLTGTWRDAKGTHPLPLRLRRVAQGPETDRDCRGPLAQRALRAYNAPRLAALAPKTSTATFEGRVYQALAVPGVDISTLQLPPQPKPVPRLNQHLRRWLGEQVLDYLECMETGAEERVSQGMRIDTGDAFATTYIPVFWNAHLLVLNEQWGRTCSVSSGLNFSAASHLVWDLDRDQAVAPRTWLREASDEVGEALPPEVLALVLKQFAETEGADDECLQSLGPRTDFFLHPNIQGMVFTPGLSQGSRGCERDTLVSWAALKPHLSVAGERALREQVLAGSAP